MPLANRGRKSYAEILRTDPVRREFHVDPLQDPNEDSPSADAEIYVPSRSFERAGARRSGIAQRRVC
ncbi:uncharacterized protein SETTUDRAFT_164695 [Exserohilum turcica Et28A]|uniref:Uncharacterized protein n=1 Tax=Exserohilum turcicum (strain 28A) TaxID=671987 RepID=R0ID13_EXST2|nr:uncharacterized protein SETTUDRAFT_164695 [Exserohilum turcica Et28A]EOA83255.1 hypothetical protein SETTUDRAFT_164695 [Exserohilum turcica Et28A]